jgi:hypothetical protein
MVYILTLILLDWRMIGRWTPSPLFFNVLYSLRLSQGGYDKLCWTPLKIRSFEVIILQSSPSPLLTPPFLGRAFGVLRFV